MAKIKRRKPPPTDDIKCNYPSRDACTAKCEEVNCPLSADKTGRRKGQIACRGDTYIQQNASTSNARLTRQQHN